MMSYFLWDGGASPRNQLGINAVFNFTAKNAVSCILVCRVKKSSFQQLYSPQNDFLILHMKL